MKTQKGRRVHSTPHTIMEPVRDVTKDELLKRLKPHGQERLLAFWDQLTSAQRQSLAAQILEIDFTLIGQLCAKFCGETGREQKALEDARWRKMAEQATPLDPKVTFRLSGAKSLLNEARAAASEAIAAGKVGVILVAGGLGTRLKFDHPKGTYKIGPVSGHSLFQIHFEKIRAVARRYNVSLPLYLMTSPSTEEKTREFLEDNDYFGLPKEDIVFFCQETLPAVDAATGKILLKSQSEISVSPNGHGGMLTALGDSGALKDMVSRGIEHLFHFQVDNPLVNVCSEEIVGYHLLSQSEMSSQVIEKSDPTDKVGNIVQVDGRLGVIEYSDLPDELAKKHFDVIWAGSIAVHMFAVSLLQRMAKKMTQGDDILPFHRADKGVSYVNANGDLIEPEEDEKNAVKFERFIFDLMPHADNPIVVQVDAAEGFAPLKNAADENNRTRPEQQTDTPEWVRAMMMARARRWLRAAGAKVADNVEVEICPLFAADAERLRDKIEPGTQITGRTYFCRNWKITGV